MTRLSGIPNNRGHNSQGYPSATPPLQVQAQVARSHRLKSKATTSILQLSTSSAGKQGFFRGRSSGWRTAGGSPTTCTSSEKTHGGHPLRVSTISNGWLVRVSKIEWFMSHRCIPKC